MESLFQLFSNIIIKNSYKIIIIHILSDILLSNKRNQRIKNMKDVIFKKAVRDDIPLILSFIKELAEYQHLEDQMVATADSLERWMFDEERADVIFCVYEGIEVGFAVYYKSFSTLLGKCSIHLEDLYVKPEYRRHGFGRAILRKLAQITRDQGFERLEWCCLDWNKSSIAFYLSIGATPMDEWTTYRLSGESLKKVIEG